jgi:hypothetical protein
MLTGSRDELQLFFDLGKKDLARANFFFVSEGQLDALAQNIDLSFQFRLVKKMNLVCGLFTAGAELLNPFPAQQFFKNLDIVIALLDFSALGRQFLLKTCQ